MPGVFGEVDIYCAQHDGGRFWAPGWAGNHSCEANFGTRFWVRGGCLGRLCAALLIGATCHGPPHTEMIHKVHVLGTRFVENQRDTNQQHS